MAVRENPGDAWAPLADRFIHGHYGTIRGRVRTHVIDAHLRAHLPPPPAALVDVGGGGGNQSIPLARSGYDVTIIDPSDAMLAGAQEALASEPAEVARRVRLVRAGAEDAAAAVGERRFDGVLCHGVIMYVEDPAPFVAALAGLAGPGAVVSLVAKNARCLATRPALEGRWRDALAAFDTDRQVNGLGVDTRADTVEDLTALLSRAGVEGFALCINYPLTISEMTFSQNTTLCSLIQEHDDEDMSAAAGGATEQPPRRSACRRASRAG